MRRSDGVCTLPMTCDIVCYEANGLQYQLSSAREKNSSKPRAVREAVWPWMRVVVIAAVVEVDAKACCEQFPERSHMTDKMSYPRQHPCSAGIRVWISKRGQGEVACSRLDFFYSLFHTQDLDIISFTFLHHDGPSFRDDIRSADDLPVVYQRH